MLALIRPSTQEVAALGFGEPVRWDPTDEELVEWVLEDFDARRADLWGARFDAVHRVTRGRLEAGTGGAAALVPPLRALGFFAAVGTTPLVLPHLASGDSGIRIAAIDAIGRIADLEALSQVEPLLDAAETPVRRAAMLAFARFPDDRYLAKLDAAAGGDPALSAIAASARSVTASFGASDASAMVDAVIATDEYETLLALMEGTGNPLLAILSDRARDVTARCRAAWLLGVARFRDARAVFGPLVADRSEPRELRIEAARAAARSGARSAAPPLIAALQEPDVELARAAAWALGRLRAIRAFEPLVDAWDAMDGSLRDDIRVALGHLANRSGTEYLEERLRDGEELPPETDFLLIGGRLELSRRYQEDWIVDALAGAKPGARCDAALVAAFYGSKGMVERLRAVRTSDPDQATREIAGLAAGRIALKSR